MTFQATSSALGAYRASESHVAITPRWYKPNGTRRGVIFCHGVGGLAFSWRDAAHVAKINALVAAGYPVISADLSAAAYAGANWANADHVSAIAAAFTYLTATMGAKTDKAGLYCASMGAAGGLAWARANLSSCFAVAAAVPVLDIDDIYQNDKGSLRGGIATAYAKGITTVGALSTGVNTSTFVAATGVLNVAATASFASSGTIKVATAGTTATITYTGKTATTFTGCTTTSGGGIMTTGGAVWDASLGDLSTRAPVSFGASDLAALPVRLWSASDDPIASTTASCTSWDGKGATKTVTDLGAVGHSAASVDAQQVVQFFDDAGGRT